MDGKVTGLFSELTLMEWLHGRGGLCSPQVICCCTQGLTCLASRGLNIECFFGTGAQFFSPVEARNYPHCRITSLMWEPRSSNFASISVTTSMKIWRPGLGVVISWEIKHAYFFFGGMSDEYSIFIATQSVIFPCILLPSKTVYCLDDGVVGCTCSYCKSNFKLCVQYAYSRVRVYVCVIL